MGDDIFVWYYWRYYPVLEVTLRVAQALRQSQGFLSDPLFLDSSKLS